jgi:hypothetical protein
MRLEKLGNILQVVVSMCPPPPTKQEHKNIYVKISSKILGFATHLFQKTNLGSAISSIVPSSFTQNTFFLFYLMQG